MMKKRTDGQRNLHGGILGGMLGVLSFGYFTDFGWLAMLIGCLLGVTLGYYADKIRSAGTKFYQTFIGGPSNDQLKPLITLYDRWKVRLASLTTYLIIISALAVFTMILTAFFDEDKKVSNWASLTWLSVISYFIFANGLLAAMRGEEKDGIGFAYQQYLKRKETGYPREPLPDNVEAWAENGFWGILLLRLKMEFYYHKKFVARIVGLLGLVLALVPTVLMLVLVILRFALFRSGHLLCLVCTLLATGMVLFFGKDYTVETLHLMGLAILAGLTSGATALGAHRLISKRVSMQQRIWNHVNAGWEKVGNYAEACWGLPRTIPAPTN